MVTTKEGIVTLRVAGLAVPGCKGLSTMVRRPTYAVLSRNQFCRELRAHGRGGRQKVTSDDEGEGGGARYPPKMMTSFMNSPLQYHCPKIYSIKSLTFMNFLGISSKIAFKVFADFLV